MSDEDPYTRLMAWLADKPEDVWFDCVDRVNWDEPSVLLDIVDHPRCTRPLAARIFWSTGVPHYLAEDLLDGGRLDENDEATAIILRILRNWRKGLYRAGEIAFKGTGDVYREMLQKFTPRPDPLDVPDDMFHDFVGRMPHVDPAMTPFADPHIWELYTNAGLECGERPEIPGNAPAAQPYRTDYETLQSPTQIDPRYVKSTRADSAGTSATTPAPDRLLGLSLIAFSVICGGLLYWLGFFR